MAPPLQHLPWELKEEILSRLPLKTLLRWRSVCKQWKSLFNDKRFIKNHFSLSPPQFILLTASKVYSIDIVRSDLNSTDPKIESWCALPSSDIPFDDENLKDATITTCDEFLFCENEAALWNPWLREDAWFDNDDNKFRVVGLGYDNSKPEKVYKMLVWYESDRSYHRTVAIYDCASQELKSIDTYEEDCPISESDRQVYVPLNGNLYWLDYNRKTREYFIQSFDFSMETFKPLCLLPCQQNRGSDKLSDKLSLAVFEGDRFSLLKLRHEPRNIKVWVTKKRISGYNNGDDDGEDDVEWINLMTFSATNMPALFQNMFHGRISYFIYNTTIFICYGDAQTGVACIYVVKEDFFKKIPIASGLVNFCHCVYTPNLISLPLCFQED